VSADVQALKNQLAVCMAFHETPEKDELTRATLAGCESQLAMERAARPTLPDCYDFADAAATYDRELGEADPSPETLERAKHLTADDCGRVLEYTTRASYKRRSCLGGKVPVGWKERYGAPLSTRPFVKACYALPQDVRTNAWFRYQEELVRETGRDVERRLHWSPDGGVRVLSPPFPDEDGG
jgi:hypothetical protein